ncbi:hypothetical protein Esti_002991 [Eimeria stiedai]
MHKPIGSFTQANLPRLLGALQLRVLGQIKRRVCGAPRLLASCMRGRDLSPSPGCRFIRQTADDLSVQEAWQLLREEEQGVVTPEMLREDAVRHAVSAGLSTAELPVFGPDGLPKMQQVALKDLISEAGGRQPAAAAARDRQQPAAAKEVKQLSAQAGDRQQSAAAGDNEEEAASPVSLVPADLSASVPSPEGDDSPEDLDVSPETIQRELATYDEEGTRFQQAADVEPSLQVSEETEGQHRLQHSSRTETPRPGTAEAAEASTSAEEIEAFFAKSQKALLASLRKGRTRRDRAIVAAEEQEIQDLIQQDRKRALKALAGEARGSRAETAEAETVYTKTEPHLREGGSRLTETGDEEEEAEETLGEVSHSEVLKTIRDRLRVDPRVASEVRRQGASPEALATRVQSLLQQVTMPSVTSSVLGLRDELAALLTADATGDPKQQARRTSGRRRRARAGSLAEAGPLEETGDESEEGFVSPFFQLSDDADKGGLGFNDPARNQGIGLGSAAELQTAEQDTADDEDFTSYLQTAPARLRGQAKASRRRTGAASRRSRAAASRRRGSSTSHHKSQPPVAAGDAAADNAAVASGSGPEAPPMETAPARLDAARGGSARLEGDASLRPFGLDSIKAAVLRARRGAAAAAAVSVETAAHKRHLRGHQAGLVSSCGKREAVPPPPASGHTNRVSPGTRPTVADSEETEAPRKAAATQRPPRSSKPAIVLLPEQLRAPQGFSPATRPVRSLAEFRELQRQQPLLKYQQQLSPGKGSARTSSRAGSSPSQHRQIQQAVRHLFEQRGAT